MHVHNSLQDSTKRDKDSNAIQAGKQTCFYVSTRAQQLVSDAQKHSLAITVETLADKAALSASFKKGPKHATAN